MLFGQTTDFETIQSYKDSALNLQLDSARYWRLLLHYRDPLLFGKPKSEVDGEDFFLSPNGKKDPQSELTATIQSFFREPTPEEISESKLHPLCKFPERFRWLDSKLNFDRSLLPKLSCDRYKNWMHSLNPVSTKLIFASFYLNNPASLFGHNLLKIGSENSTRSEILDYAINFAANNSPDDSALAYTFKGLMGGYPGTFSIFPYYYKINEYNDMESRDLWEYELNFNAEESRRIASHVWELGSTYFDYFFFDENCSYHLLSLIEIGKPELRLRDKFNLYTIPSDTVKLVLEQEGLIRKKNYRPSLSSKLEQKLFNLEVGEREKVFGYLNDKIELNQILESGDGQRQAYILDAILDAKRYQRSLKKLTTEQEEKYRNILIERSKINFLPLPEQSPMVSPPEEGHGSGRIRLSRGQSSIGGYSEIAIRAAYHDFLNYDKGYVPFSTIEYFSTVFRKYDYQKNPTLEEGSLVKILSLSPINPISSPMSFFFDVGADSSMIKPDFHSQKSVPFLLSYNQEVPLWLGYQKEKNDYEKAYRVTNFNLEGTGGYTFSNVNSGSSFLWTFSLQVGAKGRANGYYPEGLLIAPQAAIFAGCSYGNWKLGLSAQYFGFSIYGYKDDYKVAPGVRYRSSQNTEIRLEGKLQKYYEEAQVSISLFF
uniref:Lnb N-terminal periplasmic domain-containing protein n=1 Tax=Leptospira ainlahdjerensis TaxID=2810033 RepID=UPI002FC99BCA